MTALSFHQALLQAEAQARSTLTPDLHERLSAAVALVQAGRVFQTSTGEWQVDSSSTAGLTYTVNGTCSCDDHHFNKPRWCKHQLAMFLSQRTFTLMQQPASPVVPQAVEPWPDNDPEPAAPWTRAQAEERSARDDQQPRPALDAPGLTTGEPMFSLTLKGRMAGCDDGMLTIRGYSAEQFFTNLAAARGLIETVPPQSPVLPSANGKEASSMAGETQNTGAVPQCPQHGALKPSTKRKGYYCPHKMDDGTWCPSKGK